MSTLIDAIGFSLVSLEDFEDEELACRVIDRLTTASSKELCPKRYGYDEPVTERFDKGNLQPVVERWLYGPGRGEWPSEGREGGMILKCSSLTGYQVSWRKAVEPSFSFVGGQVDLSLLRKQTSLLNEMECVVRDLIPIVLPVYGEIRNMSLKGADLPFDLRRRLPDVPWTSIYGLPYVSLFGRERLLSAPFRHVEEVSSGCIWAQASDSVFDLVPDEIKRAIRMHLGDDAFMSCGRWRYVDGKAPKFDFSKVQVRLS
jgi:hypothetical protein